MPEAELSYVLSSPRPEAHELHVELTLRGALEEPLTVALPVWTPGSYLVREYARHVERFAARTPEGPIGVRKVSKNAWALAHGGASEVTVSYDVYANDLTVRTCHADATHLYVNGAAAFVRPVSDPRWATVPCALRVVPPQRGWAVTSALPSTGPGAYLARDYDALVDAPFEVGTHRTIPLRALDRPHEIALWGSAPKLDESRLARDVTRVVEAVAGLYKELPYERYTFFLHLGVGLRGGLEHHDCSSLMASPDAFETEDSYHDLLALFAHEYLHLWHVRRVRPEGLARFDYDRENYTRLLWLFEGGASYYDWLVLARGELVAPHAYLRHLAQEVHRLEETPGRAVQTLEESSFDNWIKLYRPDEHSQNSGVSYYVKGELACAILDLELRARSNGERSLDDVLRHLWRHYGSVGKPVPESGVEGLFAAATDVDVSDVIDRCVRTTEPLNLSSALAKAGLTLRPRAGRGASLGLRARGDGGRLIVTSVARGGAAWRGGITAGDELLAFNGRRVEEGSLRERLRRSHGGEGLRVLLARREMVQELSVTLDDPSPEAYDIVPAPDATPSAKALAQQWLGPSAPALWNPR